MWFCFIKFWSQKFTENLQTKIDQMNTKKRQLTKTEDENRPPKKDTNGIMQQKTILQPTQTNFQFSGIETKTNFNFQPNNRGALGTINVNTHNPSLVKKKEVTTSFFPQKTQNVQTFVVSLALLT